MKNLKDCLINEAGNADIDSQIVKKGKLTIYISKNAEICKEFIRKCSAEFISIGLDSAEAMKTIGKNKKQLQPMKKILDKISKEIFKCNYFGLDKKCDGLANELLSVSCSHAMHGITDNDKESDWALMYNPKK